MRLRLDDLLVERKLFNSRDQAARSVRAGEVRGASGVLDQPAQLVERDAELTVNAKGRYVSRGGDKLAGTRIIPLAIEKEKMDAVAQAVSGGTVLSVLPYIHKKVAIVTTGGEVFEGLIEDGFTPVVRKKLEAFDTEEVGHVTVPDHPDMATGAILRMAEKGADVIFVTGGMSVDPDDRTPLAIKNTGADIVSYGAPVLPGAMFLVSYLGDKTILGLPGCVMHSKVTILDLILPRVMAGLKVTKKDINDLSAGGLCLSCEHCIWPACGFGAL
jgi:molybdenum cofactor synthesis domain-containing protein